MRPGNQSKSSAAYHRPPPPMVAPSEGEHEELHRKTIAKALESNTVDGAS